MKYKPATIKQQKEEAIKRLKALNTPPEIIENYKKGIINKTTITKIYIDTENGEPMAFIKIENVDEKDKEEIKKAEEYIKRITRQHGKPEIYYMMENTTEDGEILESFLFVSKDPTEWNYDNEDIKNGTPLSMVINNGDIENGLSEIGYIGIKQYENITYRAY